MKLSLPLQKVVDSEQDTCFIIKLNANCFKNKNCILKYKNNARSVDASHSHADALICFDADAADALR